MKALAERILQLKGEMSYKELEEAILRKTGKRVASTTLQFLATENREGRTATIQILAEYAEKPLAWFYQSDADIIRFSLLHPDPNPPKTLLTGALDEETLPSSEYKALIEDLKSLSPEERRAVEIMIKTLAAAKKEQTAMGE